MKRGIAVLFCFWSTLCSANELRVVVVESVANMVPDRVAEVVSVLEKTGFDVTLIALPDARALNAMLNGQADLDLFRAQGVLDNHPSLIAIEPPIRVNEVLLAVNSDDSEYCNLNRDELKSLNVVVVKGLRFFPSIISPMVRNMYYSESIPQSIKMVQSKRIDATFVPPIFIETAPAELRESIHFCSNAIVNVASHSYLHEDASHFRSKIESAYQEAFGQ